VRIAVNDELDQLRQGLDAGMQLLKPGGRMAVISFHSGEDRIVKHYFKREAAEHRGVRITKKPVKAGQEETSNNPRARSALLRVFEKGQAQE
jgi:16S rRNA (cytosine1402-N4)-methyltransferase